MGGHWLTPAPVPRWRPSEAPVLRDPQCTGSKPDPQKGPASCGFSHRQDPIGLWRHHGWGSLQPLREMEEEGGCSEHRQEQAWPVGSHAAPTPTEPTARQGCSLGAAPTLTANPGLEASPVCATPPPAPLYQLALALPWKLKVSTYSPGRVSLWRITKRPWFRGPPASTS